MISRRSLIAIAISLALLILMLWVADIGSIDLAVVRPFLLLPALTAYLVVLVLRGALYCQLAGSGESGLRRWVKLAGRHQFVFILAPSGVGDLVFPLLAGRMVGLAVAPAVTLIAVARLRDVCAVLGLGCAGLAATGHMPLLCGAAAIACFAALYFIDITLSLAGRLIHRLRNLPETDIATPANRAPAAALTLALWLAASLGVAAGFAAAGRPLSLFEAWVMLAGLNVAGALALSLAGLGVAEAGAAGVLVFLGLPLTEAVANALVARPILLLCNVAASGLVEGFSRITRMAR
ncbi:lysylphosphatidylglycerol synthase domain-containing protein [Celeribacter halophilus]|uniref:lysylphosphatidylglycerol synthase domain-containing protein n=1 Tax=Celeribacter halophilus TaxID=576117 RepID=UPI001C0886BA|nr:lysylphosphatidylglycerol synthase domain-containing protein [Celeribacter halophilus]MBU2888813.1 flippase-like domain-containing protein [Celeribacter halophilus]MDO6511810.1 lysylphosphatidylglycerol synthase domain-containing protein [Celeribacter halophilus]